MAASQTSGCWTNIMLGPFLAISDTSTPPTRQKEIGPNLPVPLLHLLAGLLEDPAGVPCLPASHGGGTLCSGNAASLDGRLPPGISWVHPPYPGVLWAPSYPQLPTRLSLEVNCLLPNSHGSIFKNHIREGAGGAP